ncbi:GXWXG protein [Xenorhabdus cabanillasii]|uniref:GXWXG protein n=1 Tax=Xenorhabdus cabanillasii TaxID=351673 RepID=A0A3D9UQW7_9GAMM|nr:DUF4334 domain-containing protein [Xenorhabdus cabanillasii]REF28354.1 GXWXG protein [Xenorhabdus cabanillasii]
MNTKQIFDELRSREKIEDESELLNFFDALPEVRVGEILSKWKGGDFNTGHWGHESLIEMNWFGKWFKSKFDAIPLVCFNNDGKLFSNHIMKGEASLWEVEFRGKSSATMIYDGIPIFDHFRKVDDNTLLGVMNGKPIEGFPDIVFNGKYYYFYLERLADFPVEFTEEK